MQLAALVAAGTMIISGCGISAGADSATTQSGSPDRTGGDKPGNSRGTDGTAAADDGALVIKEQGIFSAGGTTITSNGTFDPEDQWEESGAGQTAHVDHANVLYQIPENETELPMVFLHGYGQSRMGWMTTPDGREGWSDMFLRKGHGVFLIDEPRCGEAGATSVSGDISTKTLDQRWYTPVPYRTLGERKNPLQMKVPSSRTMMLL